MWNSQTTTNHPALGHLYVHARISSNVEYLIVLHSTSMIPYDSVWFRIIHFRKTRHHVPFVPLLPLPHILQNSLQNKSPQLGGCHFGAPHGIQDELLRLLWSAGAALMGSKHSSDALPGRARMAQLDNLPWVNVARTPLVSLAPFPSLVADGHVSRCLKHIWKISKQLETTHIWSSMIKDHQKNMSKYIYYHLLGLKMFNDV